MHVFALTLRSVLQYATIPIIVTSKVQLDTKFPDPSVAVYVTVVVPIEKESPESWVDDKLAEPELSVAVGAVHVTEPVESPLSVLADWSLGQPLIDGDSSSKDY